MIEPKIYNGMESESTQNETSSFDGMIVDSRKTLSECMTSTKRNLRKTIDLIDKICKILGICPSPGYSSRLDIDSFADDLLDNEALSANIYESVNEIKLFLIGHNEEEEAEESNAVY